MSLFLLQDCVECSFPSTSVVVDLLKIAQKSTAVNKSSRPGMESCLPFGPAAAGIHASPPFKLVIDGECCLNRLYGGFLADWACGGQWNRLVDFLSTLVRVMVNNNIVVTVFFDGAAEPDRNKQWIKTQLAEKVKMNRVLRHVDVKGTPPPKVWWVPPNCLRSTLRMMFRQMNVKVVATVRDHRHEVMEFVREHHCDGLLADDPEYVIYNPPRYFSAQNMKLTYKGSLVTKEYLMDEITRCLNIHPSRMFIVAAVLSNHMLSEKDLEEFHRSLYPAEKGKILPNELIKAVVDFARNIPAVDDIDGITTLVFGSGISSKRETLKKCLSYFAHGMKGGAFAGDNRICKKMTSSPEASSASEITGKTRNPKSMSGQSGPSVAVPSNGCRSGGFNKIPDMISLSQKCGDGDQMCTQKSLNCSGVMNENKPGSVATTTDSITRMMYALSKTPDRRCNQYCDADSCSKSLPAPDILLTNNQRFSEFPIADFGASLESATVLTKEDKQMDASRFLSSDQVQQTLPRVPTLVLRLAQQRHQLGIMEPAVHQVLSRGELRVPTTYEDVSASDLPSPALMFRPLRQKVYAILFDLHHREFTATRKEVKSKEKSPDIIIKEWVWRKNNKFYKPDLVPAVPLGWPVPTVSRLWFGKGPDDNKRRMQAFLTCMRSYTPLMYDMEYVPLHYMILCCVLRYMVSFPAPVLGRKELDAFLVQAVDPGLADVAAVQNLQLTVTKQGVLLAALFMHGVENALFANDACGAPVPWQMCCPSLFFDGKIFQKTLQKANVSKNLMELCDNRIDRLVVVQRMRSAVLQGIEDHLARSLVEHVVTLPAVVVPSSQLPPNAAVSSGTGRGNNRVKMRGPNEPVGSGSGYLGQDPTFAVTSEPMIAAAVGGGAPRLVEIYPAGVDLGLHVRQAFHAGDQQPGYQGVARIHADPVTTDASALVRGMGRGCSVQMNGHQFDYGYIRQCELATHEPEAFTYWPGVSSGHCQ